MILSVSRRTDIPAFYAEWFMERLRQKYVLVRNPFNAHNISRIPLSPENVDAIVFWTKNSKPIHKYLDEIDELKYKYYFQYTITPYKKDLEEEVQDKKEIVETFKKLSEKTGSEKVVLRYDPVILSDNYTIDFHKKAFARLCDLLAPYTKKIVFSFLDDYKKISKNIKQLNIKEISAEEMCIMAEYFADTAKKYNLKIESCAEQIDLERFGINHGKCIDNELIEKITGYKLSVGRDNQRNACGCIKCIDIGEYNTCMHKCLYCYANINKEAAFKNNKLHDKNSPLLIGYVDEIKDKITDRNIKDTKSYKKEAKFSAVQNNIDSLLS